MDKNVKTNQRKNDTGKNSPSGKQQKQRVKLCFLFVLEQEGLSLPTVFIYFHTETTKMSIQ